MAVSPGLIGGPQGHAAKRRRPAGFDIGRRTGKSHPVMPDDRKKDRYVLRSDTGGWTVLEIWTGQPAMVAGVAQSGLSEDDARHMADLLNTQARRGDSSMRK
jgi:hypothetical protein